jgi:REP element-mobilizing transposase RayT
MIDNPTKFADKFKIKSSRLQNWNYSTPGYYFITICTYNHNNFFGKIINEKMELSKRGEITKSELLKTFEIRKNIKLHEWVVMPNHVHILMEIKKQNDKYQCRDVLQNVSTEINNVSTESKKFSIISPQSNSVSNIIKQFKSAVTRQINPKTVFFTWQPRFHDQIIKDEKELLMIKNYIINNPINWEKDKYFELK